MTGKSKYTLLNKPGNEDPIQPGYRAMRYDALVWNEWKIYSDKNSEQLASIIPGGTVTPGNFALYLLNPELLKTGYPNAVIDVSLLEECMNDYQLFLQHDSSPIDVAQAAKIATVLIEKRKISETWDDVFAEITAAFKSSSIENFISKWKTVLGIAENLVDSPDEMIASICQADGNEFIKSLFIPALMMLARPEKEKLHVAVQSLENLKIQEQVAILRDLVELGENSLTTEISKELLNKYKGNELGQKSVEFYWDRLDETVSVIPFNQSMALLARMADDKDLEEQVLEKTTEMLNAVLSGIEIQKKGLVKDSEKDIQEVELSHADDDGVLSSQLSFFEEESRSEQDGVDSTGESIERTTSKSVAGLERESGGLNSILGLFAKNPEGFVAEVVEKKPRFDPDWQLTALAQKLIDHEAFAPAEKIINRVLKKNPGSSDAIQSAAKIYKETERPAELAEMLEAEVFCGNPSEQVIRELIDCDLKLGRTEEAFEVSELLLAKPGTTIDDRIRHAQIAAKNGKKGISRKVLSHLLEKAPENGNVLCASGELFQEEGKLDQAVEVYTKAADLEGANEVPWMRLSEIQAEQGNQAQALETLKKGLIAIPANRIIRARLAELLLAQGSLADAISILKDLRQESVDIDSSLLLLKAMKQVNDEELDDLVTQVYEDFPDNSQIAHEYADLQLRFGNYKEASKLMKAIIAQNKAESNWADTYADAVAGLDPRFSKNAKQLEASEINAILGMIQASELQNGEKSLQAQIVKAEVLLQKGLVDEANKILARIVEFHSDLTKNWLLRAQTWFAWTLAALGKMDNAFAMIRDVIDSDPALIGAQQVLAEILALSDEVQEAVEQAQLVVEMAPDLVDNLLWAGEFFTNLGKTEKAIEVLSDGAKLYPEDLRFELSLAQLYQEQGSEEDVKRLTEEIRAKLTTQTDRKTLSRVAHLLEKQDGISAVQEILEEKYTNNPDAQNALDYAGFALSHENPDLAARILDETYTKYPGNTLIACCKADLLMSENQTDNAVQTLRDHHAEEENRTAIEHSELLPLKWKLLQDSKDPVSDLFAQMSFESGEAEESLKISEGILLKDSGNVQAWLIGVEAARAIGDDTKLDQYFGQAMLNPLAAQNPYFVAENLEHTLDTDGIDGSWHAYTALDEQIKTHPLIKVIEANLLFLEGNTVEAEGIFDISAQQLISDVDASLVVQTIRNRMLIKLARLLNRWQEATAYAAEFAQKVPWNKSVVQMYLQTLVQSLEFNDVSQRLAISVHTAMGNPHLAEPMKALDWIEQNLTDDEYRNRWLTRGRLAVSPDQKGVRSFAQAKPSAEDAAVLMRALYKLQQFSTAEQICKKFADSEEVLLQSALNNFEQSPEDALKAAKKMVSMKSNSPVALALSGYLLKKLGKNDLAIVDLEGALAIWPGEVNWHKAASELWMALGNDEKAIQHLEIIKSTDPGDYKSGIKLSKAYLARNNFADAIELLGTLAGTEPNESEIWEVLTDAYMAAGQVNEAIDAAEKASLANPFSIKPYLIRAKIDLDNGLIDKALDQAMQANEKVKDDAQAKVALARVLFAKGEKAAALAELENATHCKNLDPTIILEEIHLIKDINGTASARNLIEYFARQMPENTELLSLLAVSQLENGDSHGAEVTARRVLKLKPDSVDMLKFIGKRQFEKGQLDQAVHTFSQVVSLDRSNTEAYYALGSIYEKQRETTKAIEVLNQLIDLKPGETNAYVNLSGFYKEAKNYKLAEEMLKKAVELEPKNVNIKRQLGALLALKLVHQSQEVSSQL